MNDAGIRQAVLGFALCSFLSGFGFAPRLVAQESMPSQVAGVDQSKTGAYRALAELCYEAFQVGDKPKAAKIAKILERTWDKGEELGGENAVRNLDPHMYEEIDSALDDFVKPLIQYSTNAPSSGVVRSAYDTFLEKLKLANSLISQSHGVQLNRMGTYRALTQLSYQAATRGDNSNAEKIAMILSITWAKDEEGGGEKSIKLTNPRIYKEIDSAMNVFLEQIFNRPSRAADLTALEAAYNSYLEKLGLGNSGA